MQWDISRLSSGNWSIEYSYGMKEWFAYRSSSSPAGPVTMGPYKSLNDAFDAVEGKAA